MKKSPKTQGLGKGLGALIRQDFLVNTPSKEEVITTQEFEFIPLEDISPNKYQPRQEFDQDALEELAASIKEHGIIQPITVRKSTDGYELVSGERRLRASKLAGLATIPAYIRDISTNQSMIEMAIIENIQRKDLNPIEVAMGYDQLISECSLTQEEVAQKVGKNRATISNLLRLLHLPAEVQTAIRANQITTGHAKAILSLEDAESQIEALQNIIDKDMSVRETEQYIRELLTPLSHNFDPLDDSNIVNDQPTVNPYLERYGIVPNPIGRKAKKTGNNDQSQFHLSSSEQTAVAEIENSLRQLLATQVHISLKNKQNGAVVIDFYSFDDLDRLVDLLQQIKP